MKKRYVGNFSTEKIRSHFIPFIIGIFFLLIFMLLPDTYVREAFSFVFAPIQYYGNSVGSGVNTFGETYLNVGQLREENEALLLENAQLKAQNSVVTQVQQQNLALARALNLGNVDNNYMYAEVVKYDSAGYITLNVGSNNGVQEGDIVVLGNLYIGRVSQVLARNVKVQLPSNEASSLRVEITNKVSPEMSLQDLRSKYDQISKNVVQASAEGSPKGVFLSNIALGSDVQVGNIAVINDVKVNELMVLGEIKRVISDPTQPYNSAELTPIINFEELTYVFVRLSD